MLTSDVFTGVWLEHLESSFENVRNDLHTYLFLIANNCSGER